MRFPEMRVIHQIHRERAINTNIYVDLPLFVAEEEGFFKRHGVETELVRFAASPEIGTALTTGGVNVGASIAFSVALSNESSSEKIVGGLRLRQLAK